MIAAKVFLMLIFFTSFHQYAFTGDTSRKEGEAHDCEGRMNQMEKKFDQMEKELTRKIELQEKSNGELQKEIKALKDANNRDAKAEAETLFAAYIRLPGEYYIPPGLITSFTDILINRGERFDSHDGIFEAPHSGTYEFVLDANMGWTSVDGNGVSGSVELRVNGETQKFFAFETNTDDDLLRTLHVNGIYVVNLLAFDIVQLYYHSDRVDNYGTLKGFGTEYLMFSGKSL